MSRIMSFARTVIAAGTLLGLIAVGAVNAQEPLLDRAVQRGWLRYSVIDGRLTLDETQFRNMHSTTTTTTTGTQHKEELHLRNENGRPALDYEQTNDKERLTINVVASAGRVSIQREPRGESPVLAVKFEQTADQEITLVPFPVQELRVFETNWC